MFLKGVVTLIFIVSNPQGKKKEISELQSHKLSKNHRLSDNRMKVCVLLSSTIMIFPKCKNFAIAYILLFYMEEKDHIPPLHWKKKSLKFIKQRSRNVPGIQEPGSLSWLPHLPISLLQNLHLIGCSPSYESKENRGEEFWWSSTPWQSLIRHEWATQSWPKEQACKSVNVASPVKEKQE